MASNLADRLRSGSKSFLIGDLQCIVRKQNTHRVVHPRRSPLTRRNGPRPTLPQLPVRARALLLELATDGDEEKHILDLKHGGQARS
jgi:hypothetical protein